LRQKFLPQMITRRNVRIKAMQSIYASMQTAPDNPIPFATKLVNESYDKTRDLFYFLTNSLVSLALYVEKDASFRANKHLPTQEDLSINTKLAKNITLNTIAKQNDFIEYSKRPSAKKLFEEDWLKPFYQKLILTPEYKTYLNSAEGNAEEDLKFCQFLLSDILLPDADFEEKGEEGFNNWDDDIDMLRTLLLAQLEQPSKFKISGLIGNEKQKFGLDLVDTYFSKKEVCDKLYVPKLRNWDESRIAVLDKIIISMGICEFLFFETIPPKVTINEYIDLGKAYSTKQSGQFINGILDSIRKELEAENKLHKSSIK
jgi:transcription antitermination protein NusB